MKSLDEYFADWESHVFGFGYGSGEPHVLRALETFLTLCPEGGSYDYEILEAALTAPTAWLMINAMGHADIIEYGTSSRYAWLTTTGKRIRSYIFAHSLDEIVHIVCGGEHDYCAPDVCNCGINGYENGLVCQNPFWLESASFVLSLNDADKAV